jgi:hypothetical protein
LKFYHSAGVRASDVRNCLQGSTIDVSRAESSASPAEVAWDISIVLRVGDQLDILVATPGLLKDLMNQGLVRLGGNRSAL